ncbi:hypothetical protein N0V95_002786 [Ascochyta clinopodiicola]|nr:hypothetical protein N0V95_002786 [Ascochyta clinopodiicola]
MDTNRIPNMPTARSTTSLSAIAKAITNFLFGELPLPTSLSRYATFFTGLVTGAMGATALYTYLHRNKRDRAKIQLAVYHIIHILQHHPDHQDLLQRPQELLRRMEPEALRMVDKHLTINEAEEVTKVLKRRCEAPQVEACAQKRVRENECVVSEQMGLDSIAARPQSQRGFLPEFGPDWIERPQEFKLTPVRSETQPFSPLNTREPWSDFSTQEDDGLDDCNQPTSDQKQLQFECGQYDDDMMNLDDSSHLTHPNTTMTPCPHDHRSSAPSPESSPTFVGFASTPIPAPKDDGYAPDDEFDAADELDGLATPLAEASKMSTQAIGKQSMESPQQHRREGYGLSYNDSDLYSSSSSEEKNASASSPPTDEYTPPNWINEMLLKTNDPPLEGYAIDTPLPEPQPSTRPPTVIAMVRGVKGRGASLSPIAEGSSDSPRSMDDGAIRQERLDAALAQEETVPHLVPHTQAQTTTTQSEETLPFAHWTTTPEITYSSSSSSSSSSKSETLTEPETETVPNPVTLESLSFPPKKRKSPFPSSEQEETSTISPPPKRRRTSPLRDITTSYAGTPTPSPSPPSPEPHSPTTPQPSPSPCPRSRRRSHRRRSREDTRSPAAAAGAAAAAPSTPPPPRSAATAQTPGAVTGTRKSGRSKSFGGVYTA